MRLLARHFDQPGQHRIHSLFSDDFPFSLYWRDPSGGYGSAGTQPERRLSGRDSGGRVISPARSPGRRNPGKKAINPRSARAEPSQ